MFTPVFRTDVYETNPPDSPAPTTPITDTYCLTEESAKKLSVILGNAGYPPRVFDAWPLFQDNSGAFVQSDEVPWFGFMDSDGVEHTSNAGLIADAWRRRPDGASALAYAVVGIENLLKGN